MKATKLLTFLDHVSKHGVLKFWAKKRYPWCIISMEFGAFKACLGFSGSLEVFGSSIFWFFGSLVLWFFVATCTSVRQLHFMN